MKNRFFTFGLASLLFAAVPSGAEPPRVQIESKSPVLAVAWSRMGNLLAVGCEDGTVRIFDVATGKETRTFSTGGPVLGIALSADAKVLAISQPVVSVSTWDIAAGKLLKSSTIKDYKGEHLAFTPDGLMVVGCSLGTSFQFQLKGGFSGSRSANPGPGCAAIAADGTVSGWATAKGIVQIREYNPSKATSLKLGPVNCMALAPGGRLMAYGGTGNDVQLVELLTKKESNKLTGLASPPLKLSFSGDGNTLAALASDGATVRIWDLARNATRRQLNHNRGAAGAFALSPDGKVLATTALAGKMLVLWDVGTRELTHKGPPLKFTTDELGALWTDLANTDFEKADAAWQKIAAAGDNAVPFLHKQIQPIAMPVVDMKHIDKLVADLDADKFAIRDRATKELIGVGEMAIVPLQRLLEKRPSQEAVTRANLVLKKLSEPVLTPERLRVLEAIELLEALQTPKAVNLLQEIERGALIAQLRTEARRALQRIEAANEDKK